MAFGFSKDNADFNSRDFDSPAREAVHDPLTDLFGDTYYSPPNWQLDDVFDETGGKKIFWRCYATKPCRTLVDVYKVKPSSGWYVDEDTSRAVAAMRAIALTKAEKIAAQVEAHNLAHPSDRDGLIQIIGDDKIEKDDVATASQGLHSAPSAFLSNDSAEFISTDTSFARSFRPDGSTAPKESLK